MSPLKNQFVHLAIVLQKRKKLLLFICILVCTSLSYITYFHQYQNPSFLINDEHHYLPDAERELQGYLSMKHNPPLGKQLIALGQYLFGEPEKTQSFRSLQYIQEVPRDISMTGYRFFPVLCASLISLVLFGVVYVLSGKPVQSVFLSGAVLFDNALIAHNRAAILEGPFLLFFLLTIFFFILLIQPSQRRNALYWSIGCGLAWGLCVSVKFQGIVLLLLLPFLYWKFRSDTKKVLQMLSVICICFVVTNALVWQMHFVRGTQIDTALPNDGYFGASQEYKYIIENKSFWSPSSFIIMMRDSIRYAFTYNDALPDIEEVQHQMASEWYTWPFGVQSVRYVVGMTRFTRGYIFMQINPWIWFTVLIGMCLSVIGILVAIYKKGIFHVLDTHTIHLALLSTYIGYMFGMAQIDRVLYLYHYLPAFLISVIVCSTLFRKHGSTVPYIWFLVTILVFLWYKPLTYLQPITDEQVRARAILPIWNLQPYSEVRK